MSPSLPLLALIARGDAYGYELKRIVEREFVPYWSIDFAQLYRSLAKLRTQELVRVRTKASEEGPDRKLYSITPRGRAAVSAWLHEPAESRHEFWVKLYLATGLGQDTQFLVRAERERMENERQTSSPMAGRASAPLLEMPLRIAGSDDALLARLAQDTNALAQVNGSTAGLVALAQSEADVVGSHLHDPDSDEYNVSFVQHLVAEQDILLVHLAVREYGLLVAPGNPKGIRGVRDLKRRDMRLLNRTRGSGARLWLQRHVRAAHLDPNGLPGWASASPTYEGIAREISAGSVDVGPGLRGATAERFGLGFVSIGQEQFDVAIPRALYESRRGDIVREVLHSASYREYGRALPGYDLARSGRVIAEIKFGQRRK